MIKNAIVLLAGAFLLSAAQPQLTATQIVQKSEDNIRGKSNQSELTINIVRPKWQRSLGVKSWAKGTEMSMILITEPARDKGTVFLKRDKEIWNYIPAVERNIKLPPSMMMQSWMGTDFNNDDLVRESSMTTDYTQKLLGEASVRNEPCYKIELTPKPEAAVVWGKIICMISKADFLQLQTDFYDEDGTLINRLEGFDVKTFDKRKLPARMRMTPMDKEGHYTEMTYKSIAFDVDISDDFFTTQNMKRIH